MAAAFKVKVVTPQGTILEESALQVTLPSAEGVICFLPGHANYSGILGTGLVDLKTESGEIKRLVVSEGFCDFHNNTLSLLADVADLTATTTENYSAEREALKHIIANLKSTEADRESAKIRLKRIEAIDSLVSH